MLGKSNSTSDNPSQARYPKLPGHTNRKHSDASFQSGQLENELTYGKLRGEVKEYTHDLHQKHCKVQLPQDVYSNDTYSIGSTTLASAHSRRSPAQNLFPPKGPIETLKDGVKLSNNNVQSHQDFCQSDQSGGYSDVTLRNPPSDHTDHLKCGPAYKGTSKNQHTTCQSETEVQLAWLGYKQELFRDWDFWASFSLSCANIGVFPGSFWALYAALGTGGPIIMIWGYAISMVFMCCLNAVLAEMSSAYPVTGAMFTWTFKLARLNPKFREWARLLSWTVGFLLSASHVLIQVQLSSQFIAFFSGVFTASGFHWSIVPWQKYLMSVGWLFILGLVACTAVARSPIAWKVAGILNVMACITICITLLVTAKHQRPFYTLFTEFNNKTTWKSNLWVFIYGSAQSTLYVGAEPAAHLAEETKEASSTVPRVMFWSTFASYLSGFAINICVTKALVPVHHHTHHVSPLIGLIFTSCPKPAAQLIIGCLIFIMALENISQLLAASRFFWALSRDSAIPFAHYWHQISKKRRIPRRATFLLVIVSAVTCVIDLDNTGKFIAVIMGSVPLFVSFCYIVPIILYLSGEQGPMDRDGRHLWSLRGYSRTLAWISLVFLLAIIAICSAPSTPHITPDTWSWSPLVLIGMIFISVVTWITYGQSNYAGPVKSITVWTVGQEVELPNKMARVLAPAAANHPNASIFVKPKPVAELEQSQPQQTAMSRQHTYNIPDAYVSYNSEGSMWSDTETGHQHMSAI